MGRFGVAAILAALCLSLCLYGSSGSSDDLKFAARATSWRKHSAQGQWLHCPAHGLRVSAPAITDDSIRWQRWRGSSSSSSSDSELAECANYQVKYQHECNNHGVKTLYRELCSSRARSCISPHTGAPLPLHCLCDSGRAAAMTCVQHTSIDRQWGCVLRCPGTSCCSAQLGATRTSGELLRQRNCITRGIAHGATKLQTRRGTRRSATESSLGS